MGRNHVTFIISTLVLSIAFILCVLSSYFAGNLEYQTYVLGMVAIVANIFQIRSFLVENRERENREKENQRLQLNIENLKKELVDMKEMQYRQMSVEQLINHVQSRINEMTEQ